MRNKTSVTNIKLLKTEFSFQTFFRLSAQIKGHEISSVEHLHGAVWSFLMADEIVGSKHHLTDVTVKTRFVPVLRKKKKITPFYTAILKLIG